MFSTLQKPYPKQSAPIRKILFGLLFGLFVFVFLWVFQPFGLTEWKVSHKVLKLLGFGAITSAVILFHSFIIEKIFLRWFKEENWKVWKEIVWALWTMFFIGCCNLYYSHWLMLFPINGASFINYQFITLVIGIFPVTLITLLNQGRLQKRNLLHAEEINHLIEQDTQEIPTETNPIPIQLASESGKDELLLMPDDLLVMVSADNYVDVYFWGDDTVKKVLLRNTLKNLEVLIGNHPSMFRCHRSYLVNLKRVDQVVGNSQGYKLQLTGLDFMVPVSRNLNETIHQKIKEIHSIHP